MQQGGRHRRHRLAGRRGDRRASSDPANLGSSSDGEDLVSRGEDQTVGVEYSLSPLQVAPAGC